MLAYVLDTVTALAMDRTLVVLGFGADQVRATLAAGLESVIQKEQLGTGHAVMTAVPALRDGEDEILVLPGDAPLITVDTLKRLLQAHRQGAAAATMLTAVYEDPAGYGRVLRDAGGELERVVEESDADDTARAIREVNTCIYVFAKKPLLRALERLDRSNTQSEYYLTDVIQILAAAGERVLAAQTGDPLETMGINSRAQLAEAAALMRGRINRGWMDEGVTLEDPDMTYIGGLARIGRDTVIRPLTFIAGATVIGEGCLLGPACRIQDSRIGDGARVQESVLVECEIGENANVGPYASVRPGTVLGPGAKLGTFVEAKNTKVGRGSKVPHLSYMGDADIGENANVGAGSITCNYDGEKKYRTVIEDEAFIGSDTMLVAPVKIGRGAVTGAGSAITKDVPDGALGVERAQQKNISGWRRNRKGEDERDNP
jgi:bifunctional UDP-N-acetylglucosamine pyrophosphorylase/glucosamine-1-phosphate N-acetyltransferase